VPKLTTRPAPLTRRVTGRLLAVGLEHAGQVLATAMALVCAKLDPDRAVVVGERDAISDDGTTQA
jgi:hypothetical protein